MNLIRIAQLGVIALVAAASLGACQRRETTDSSTSTAPSTTTPSGTTSSSGTADTGTAMPPSTAASPASR